MSNTQQPTRVVTVNPGQAQSWLKRQELLVAANPEMRQRNVKQFKVEDYARDMKAGDWQLNGETLIFASNGRILDGQHRLLACVKAGVAFRTHVVEGVPHEAMKTINTGALRTLGDQFAIAGRQNVTNLATAACIVWRWERLDRKSWDLNWNIRPTRQESFLTLEAHPSLEAYAQRSNRLKTLMSQGLAAALWYLFSMTNSDAADQFFNALASGADLAQDDPVFLLRERLLRERRDAMIRHAGVAMAVQLELVVRAWDAKRRGQKLTKLQRGHAPKRAVV